MRVISIQPAFPLFAETDGTPLETGFIYIGTVNLNPETNPITVYWDSALTIPAAQPIRTIGGRPVRDGSASNLYIDENYSLTARDKNGGLIYTALNSDIPVGSLNYLTGISGVDTIIANATPFATSYVEGNAYSFVSVGANTGAVTLNIDGLGSRAVTKDGATALDAGDIPNGAAVIVIDDGTQLQLINLDTSLFARKANIVGIQGFRLSMSATLPVTASDISNTSLFALPYKGNKIALYDGVNWNVRSAASISLGLTVTANIGYDVFYYDNAGTPALEILAWTNSTTRATALAYQDGIRVKSGDATRRYAGSFLPLNTTSIDDTVANRNLWNYDHRVPRAMSITEVLASWTWTSSTLHQANASSANQLNFFVGLIEDAVHAAVSASGANSLVSYSMQVAIGHNSTSVAVGHKSQGLTTTGNFQQPFPADVTFVPTLGLNSAVWLEAGAAGGGNVSTFFGTSGGMKSGIDGSVLA